MVTELMKKKNMAVSGQNKLTTHLMQDTILDCLLIEHIKFYLHMIFNISWITSHLAPKLYQLSY